MTVIWADSVDGEYHAWCDSIITGQDDNGFVTREPGKSHFKLVVDGFTLEGTGRYGMGVKDAHAAALGALFGWPGQRCTVTSLEFVDDEALVRHTFT